MAPSCQAETLAVPWLLQSEWSSGVWLAHRVFASLVVTLMVLWLLLFLELCTLRLTFRLTGYATIGCGWWLVAWVFLLLKPGKTPMLLEFAFQDVAQEQHLAIGMLLAAAGMCELAFSTALARRPRHEVDLLRWPHVVWGVCVGLVGLLFVLHPQRDADETRRHVALGLGLAVGATLLAREKCRGKLDHDQAVGDAPLMIVAAICFGVAALMLFTFPAPHVDRKQVAHEGVAVGCRLGHFAALAALCFACAVCARFVWVAAAAGCRAAGRLRDEWRRAMHGPLAAIKSQDQEPI